MFDPYNPHPASRLRFATARLVGHLLPLPRAKDTGEGTRSNAVGLFGCGFCLSNTTTFAARTEDLAVGATPYRRMKLQNLSVFIRVHLWFKIL